MVLFVSALVFILGSAIGSFLSVIIYRLHTHQKGIFFSRSMCPACKKQLKWKHLVPVLSFIFLRGKCAYCGNKISSHYLTLELSSGIIFLALFLNFNFLSTAQTIANPEIINYVIDWKIFEIFLFYIIEFSFLIGTFYYDYLYKEIPDTFSIPAIILAVIKSFVLLDPKPLPMILGGTGIFVFFLLQLLISKGKWIGGGDLRMGALMGFLLGWERAILALILAYIMGAFIGIILIIRKKATGKSAIAFGPFLVLATIITVFFGDFILNYYFSLLNI